MIIYKSFVLISIIYFKGAIKYYLYIYALESLVSVSLKKIYYFGL